MLKAMDAKTRNRLADRLNDAIRIIEEVVRETEKDPEMKTIGRVLGLDVLAPLNANSVVLRGQVVT
jgi:hypothetical protein